MSALDQVREEEEREAAVLAARRGYELDTADTEPPPTVQASAIAIAKAAAHDTTVGPAVPIMPRSLMEQLGWVLGYARDAVELAEDQEHWESEHCIEVSETTKAAARAARSTLREVETLVRLVQQLPLNERLRERPTQEAP